jgi:AraC family transcriptional regulator of adaptative response / DNA-3-methyladenine glycosylase II
MTFPIPFSWPRQDARAGKLNGRFLIGVLSTGIYCLPSCPARPPKPQNVRLFPTEAAARAAGLRACKRCRPDLFYRGEDENAALFEGLAARVAAAPEAFANASALAKACGVSLTKLGDLLRDHAHMTPVAWLRRQRVAKAARELLATRGRVAEIGYGAGFESESVFHRQFVSLMRMTPGAYRALDGAKTFLVHLPPGYRAREVLAYHARDPEGVCEKNEGSVIWKAIRTPDAPAVLEISVEKEGAWVTVHADKRLGRESMAMLHAASLRMLSLTNTITQFETRHAVFTAGRRGLRLPLLPTGFDALCWAVIGQQINVRFATALRRDFIRLAGEKIGNMVAHPTPQRVAALDVPDLRRLHFSGSKAGYLIDAARDVAKGGLDIERLAESSAVAAEKRLTARRGVGTWTARYVMLRCGFADAAPVGDSALATALQQLHGLAERPDPDHAARLMSAFSPHRSLATMHLWTALKERGLKDHALKEAS